MTVDLPKLSAFVQKVQTVNDHIWEYLARETGKDGRVSIGKLDRHQLLAFDAAWIKAQILAATQIVQYAIRLGGDLEARLTQFYVADILQEISSKVVSHMSRIGLTHEKLEQTLWSKGISSFVSETLDPSFYEPLAELIESRKSGGTLGISDEQNLIRETFKKYAEEKIWPIAEKVHREDLLIPEDIIKDLKELGCFGLSIPQRYGGLQDDAKPDNMGMIIVTEELSRGSLGIAGSLITRPEILAKALLKGGTEEQRQKWLPPIAAGEKMVSVAVTEPDYGSDVAGMKVSATKKDGGWAINGVKTWCTFAGYGDTLLVLVRTDLDLSKGHKGLSIVIAEKPRFKGHSFNFDQPNGGHISGKAIGTIGYRGMHSYEVSFQDYFVPNENVIGGDAGLGKGFYLQMEGFAGGRLQTAARALGVMQAAFEKALQYSTERSVFGKTIIHYQLTKYKLVRMAAVIQAARQLTYHAARLMDEHKGQMEASLVKFYASRMSEWVTREAMQLHGGMGYAEEYAVSRYFVDARVFSIFEGAEDILALRVIARSLIEEKLKKSA